MMNQFPNSWPGYLEISTLIPENQIVVFLPSPRLLIHVRKKINRNTIYFFITILMQKIILSLFFVSTAT